MAYPSVSILIPVRNEANYVERCLEAVFSQDYPKELTEILIADGMSEDNTRELINSLSKNNPQIRLFDNPNIIVASGLNLLTSKSDAKILIRIDGHCVISPNYVSNCVKYLQKEDVVGVGGPMESVGVDYVSKVISIAMSSKFGVGNSTFRTETYGNRFVDTIPFPAYTREIIEKVGPYDEELVRNQDDEYNYRIRKTGAKILFAEDVQSVYFSRQSLKQLWKQYFQYGFYKVRVLQKHPTQMMPRQFVPPLFVLTIVILLSLAFFFSLGWFLFLIIFGIYVISNLLASIFVSVRNGFHYFWLLPFSFATLHFSYGCGFLIGFINFWDRWDFLKNKKQGV